MLSTYYIANLLKISILSMIRAINDYIFAIKL